MMRSPPALKSNMDLPQMDVSGRQRVLDNSQTTFRRTPLRVRVEDLMVVDEGRNRNAYGGGRSSSQEDRGFDKISISDTTGRHSGLLAAA